MQKYLLTGLIVATLFGFLFAGPATLSTITAAADRNDQTTILGDTQTSSVNGTQVDIGKGSNMTVQYYTYTPNKVEINAGESVTWFSSAEMLELHTVTFSDPSVFTDIILPFSVSGEDPKVLPPFNAGDPIIMDMPNGTAIVALNKLAFNPSVMDQNNQTNYLNGTDIEFTMTGDEKVVNSGMITPPMPEMMAEELQNGTEVITPESADNDSTGSEVPHEEEMIGPPFPIVNSFTVTFENPGTYDYFCALHPWMTGQVVVSDGTSTSSTGDNSLSNGTTTLENLK